MKVCVDAYVSRADVAVKFVLFWHGIIEMTCPRSQMNRLNDVTVSRISVRLGWKDLLLKSNIREKT